MANIIGINFESIVDGDGVRVTLYFSGCKHQCLGCHNPSSHNFDAGRKFTEELQDQIIAYIKDTPFISGITLSGGDPMYSAAELIPFVEKVRSVLPNINFWIYSGFVYEEIKSHPEMKSLLSLCEVLVDGEFILALRDSTLSYRGSKNQRIINIAESLKKTEVVLYEGDKFYV